MEPAIKLAGFIGLMVLRSGDWSVFPEERAFLETISPYQNFDASKDYPVPFFVTSTKDDRVHPGHARKMAKLFEAAGKPFLYYENIDGGHSAAANQQETAKRVALEFTYLTEKLMAESTE